MRRDQVFKICLNHAVTADLTFKSMDERSWLWAVVDFAEDAAGAAGAVSTFAIRFRGADEAKAFMAAVDAARAAKTPTKTRPAVQGGTLALHWSSVSMFTVIR